jgi:hypothetical protein
MNTWAFDIYIVKAPKAPKQLIVINVFFAFSKFPYIPMNTKAFENNVNAPKAPQQLIVINRYYAFNYIQYLCAMPYTLINTWDFEQLSVHLTILVEKKQRLYNLFLV